MAGHCVGGGEQQCLPRHLLLLLVRRITPTFTYLKGLCCQGGMVGGCVGGAEQ